MADETAPGNVPPAEQYDQAFFLDLAAKGKDAWNAWRRNPANKDVCVIFAGIDFSEAPKDQIDFSGFEFSDRADFSGCKWRGAQYFIPGDLKAFRPGRASFSRAVFGNWASFAAAAFGEGAEFDDAAFGNWASFADAAFGDFAHFDGAAFGNWASFADAEFRGRANFPRVTFGDEANFTGTTFRD